MLPLSDLPLPEAVSLQHNWLPSQRCLLCFALPGPFAFLHPLVNFALLGPFDFLYPFVNFTLLCCWDPLLSCIPFS